MAIHSSVTTMWHHYMKVKNIPKKTTMPESWYFCYNKEDADELADLVLAGTKRATASLYLIYEAEDEVLPEEGDLSIITNFEGEAKCIIDTTKIMIIPFKNVPESFAYREGEGDKSLKYWRKAHFVFFTEECKSMDMTFTEDMLVVCEEFEVSYK